MRIEAYFSPYFIALCILAGLYMLLVQGSDLIKIEHFDKEGTFLRWAGSFYIVIGLIGILVWLF